MQDQPTDSELLARIQSDPAALELLFVRHRVSVLRYAARRCNDAADVADLISLTFLGVLESADSFDPRRGEARAWILGIAHRQWVTMLRRERRSSALTDRERGRRHLVDDDIARIDEQIDAARHAAVVEQVIACLPERHREALWLVGHDGLTNEDAAFASGVPPGVFRVRLSRARRALKRALAATQTQRAVPLFSANEVTS